MKIYRTCQQPRKFCHFHIISIIYPHINHKALSIIMSILQGYTDLNLLHPGLIEAEVKAVVGQRAHLLVVAVITDTDDRDLRLFDQLHQFLQQNTLSTVSLSRLPVHSFPEKHGISQTAYKNYSNCICT